MCRTEALPAHLSFPLWSPKCRCSRLGRSQLVPGSTQAGSSFLVPSLQCGLIHYHQVPSYSRVLRMGPSWICYVHSRCASFLQCSGCKEGKFPFLGSAVCLALILQGVSLPSPQNFPLFLVKKFLTAHVFLEELISTPSD